MYAWTVLRAGAADVRAVVDQLVARLTQRGSVCSTPKHLRAFSRFDERAPQISRGS